MNYLLACNSITIEFIYNYEYLDYMIILLNKTYEL